MFVYFYLTAQMIVEKMRMWTADEEMAEYRFHFDDSQITNPVELEKDKEKRVIKWLFKIHK